MPRCVIGVLALLVLAACHREPTFDERYAAAQAKVGKTAQDIDAQAMGSGVPPTPEDEDKAGAD